MTLGAPILLFGLSRASADACDRRRATPLHPCRENGSTRLIPDADPAPIGESHAELFDSPRTDAPPDACWRCLFRRRGWFDDEVAIISVAERRGRTDARSVRRRTAREGIGAGFPQSCTCLPRAFYGVTERLSLRKLCVRCGGRGEVWSEPVELRRHRRWRQPCGCPAACRTAIGSFSVSISSALRHEPTFVSSSVSPNPQRIR